MKENVSRRFLRIIEEQDIDTQDQLLAELRAHRTPIYPTTISQDIKGCI